MTDSTTPDLAAKVTRVATAQMCGWTSCPIDPMGGYCACHHGPRGDGTNDPCPSPQEST